MAGDWRRCYARGVTAVPQRLTRSPDDLPNQSPLDSDDLAAALRGVVRGQVRFSQHDRGLYATDASIYQIEPIGVVIPLDAADVSAVLAFCNPRNIAVLPRGGGTSLAGQAVNRAVVLDLSQLQRRVLSIDAARRTCRVEPGATIDQVNRELAAAGTGLFFPPDPATQAQCTIGGAIGNNAAGARSIKYGRTSENVAALTLLLPDGRRVRLAPGSGQTDAQALRLASRVADIVHDHSAAIAERFPTTLRRNAGYALDAVQQQLRQGLAEEELNLVPLICGSEGTLGVVVEAELRLAPVPAARGLGLVAFASVEAAIDAVAACLTTQPSAVELIDDVVLNAAAGNIEHRRAVELLPQIGRQAPAAVLYVEYEAANHAGELEDGFARLRAALRPALAAAAALHTYADPAAVQQAWALRRAGEPLLHGISAKRKPQTFVEDNAVPVEQLPRFVREFKAICARHGTTAAFYAHASVGLLHVRPMIDLHDPRDRTTMRSVAQEVARLARDCGGVMSGEHGDGRIRGPLLREFYGDAVMRAFAQVKQAFDPSAILNPGNIVGAGEVASITEHLRVQNSGVSRTIALRQLSITKKGGLTPTPQHQTPDSQPPIPAAAITQSGSKKTPNRPTEPFDPAQCFFDYSDQHAFTGAIEMCNGAGVCRKTAGGTMCPSYRATLDERHSTRGRGNALRLAISGQFNTGPQGRSDHTDTDLKTDTGVPRHTHDSFSPGAFSPEAFSPGAFSPDAHPHGAHSDDAPHDAPHDTPHGASHGDTATPAPLHPKWDDAETIRTLDLCLSCKACKSECPSNVDVSRLKAEYTAQRFAARGRSTPGAWAVGHVRRLNRMGAVWPAMADFVVGQPFVRRAMEEILGITRRRALPAFGPSLYRWMEQRSTAITRAEGHARRQSDSDAAHRQIAATHAYRPASGSGSPGLRPQVVLFGDCFTAYTDSHVGQSAVRVLEAFGYDVILPQTACCGRAMISTGLLRAAIVSADAALHVLGPYVRQPRVAAILVAEPSCLSAIKDDWLQLKLKTPLAVRSAVARKAFLIEEFLDRQWANHPRRPAFRTDARDLLLHGHCHQKALWGDSSAPLLRRIAGERLRVLDTGCCGMAGSFGYGVDRYDLSMTIGEQALFPAVRAGAAMPTATVPEADNATKTEANTATNSPTANTGTASGSAHTIQSAHPQLPAGLTKPTPNTAPGNHKTPATPPAPSTHTDPSAHTAACVVAPGTSCRHQIRDGTGVTALHPIQWVQHCLTPEVRRLSPEQRHLTPDQRHLALDER